MKQLQIDELRASLTDAVREAQQGETIEVVIDGNVVALLVPALPDAAERRAALARHNALAAEIGKHVTEPIDVTQILSEVRGELVSPPVSVEVPQEGQVPDIEERRAALARLDELEEEISKDLTEPIDVTEILADMRRY